MSLLPLHINPEHLACPVCKQQNKELPLTHTEAGTLTCTNCHTFFPVKNGVANLLVDATLESKLEKNPDAYIHQLKDETIQNTYDEWSALLSEFNSSKGSYLEIGSGNGMLSHGVIQHSFYSDITITDLSVVFIQNIMGRNPIQREHLYFYACDANHLPFQHNAFDVVVGRSMLHHLLHYEKCLHEIFNILKPEGKAFFLEPILQGKLLVAFFLKIILETDHSRKSEIFTADQIQKINGLIRNLTKTHRIGKDLDVLSEIEDKYIFDVEAIKKLSREIGFKKFTYKNYFSKRSGNHYPEWGYGQYVFAHVKKFGVTREQLAKFDYLFNSFGETFSDHINHQLYTPMGYFIFEK